MSFREKHLNKFISQDYFADIDKPKFYIDNDTNMCYLLNKMLTDIYRIICEQSDTDLNESINSINIKNSKIMTK